jgi:hypothetical protein
MTINPVFKVVATTGAYKIGGVLSSAQQWRAGVVTFVLA